MQKMHNFFSKLYNWNAMISGIFIQIVFGEQPATTIDISIDRLNGTNKFTSDLTMQTFSKAEQIA
jgi:hypothetical protein